MGFEVYDYTLGKVDWLAAGLPTVRQHQAPARALDALETDVTTCSPDDFVADVRMKTAGAVLVLNEERIVLGRLDPDEEAATTRDGVAVQDVMQPGPATVRAHEPLEPLLERMASRRVAEMTVTTAEGRLLGVVRHRTT